MDLLCWTHSGLCCERGGFYVDPWQPVERAVITHAHGDHARPGSASYLTATPGRRVLQTRMGEAATIETLEYGEPVTINGVTLSFHPAGHLLGSAQVRLEHEGEVWVVSGDYKLARDATCEPFEPVHCHTFITESTFGLPIYRWPEQSEIFADLNRWWRQNRDEGRASIVFAYSLGKAQRLLAGIDTSIGPVYCHGAVERVNDEYRSSGVSLPPTTYAGQGDSAKAFAGALVLAPPSAQSTGWLRKFGDSSTAFVSGWMLVRGTRRRKAVDRGFPLSDHADWPGLVSAIQATGASRVLVTHGSVAPMVRWLSEQGYDAQPLATPFSGEHDEAGED